MQEEAVPPVAHQGDGLATLVEGVTPSAAQGIAAAELLAPVPSDPLQGEGGQLDPSARSLRLERRERDGVLPLGRSDGLNAAADGDRAHVQVDLLPGDAEDLRAAGPGDRGQQDRDLPDGAAGDL